MGILGFYPRHPRGWRLCLHRVEFVSAEFLSTPPSRVATTRCCGRRSCDRRVSIHATLAGGDIPLCRRVPCDMQFLSTPPSRVATPSTGPPAGRMKMFLSTPPSRVATTGAGYRHPTNQVSIHATLAGGDVTAQRLWKLPSCFYPRHPRGWRRPPAPSVGGSGGVFLSTPPSRVATHFRVRH